MASRGSDGRGRGRATRAFRGQARGGRGSSLSEGFENQFSNHRGGNCGNSAGPPRGSGGRGRGCGSARGAHNVDAATAELSEFHISDTGNQSFSAGRNQPRQTFPLGFPKIDELLEKSPHDALQGIAAGDAFKVRLNCGNYKNKFTELCPILRLIRKSLECNQTAFGATVNHVISQLVESDFMKSHLPGEVMQYPQLHVNRTKKAAIEENFCSVLLIMLEILQRKPDDKAKLSGLYGVITMALGQFQTAKAPFICNEQSEVASAFARVKARWDDLTTIAQARLPLPEMVAATARAQPEQPPPSDFRMMSCFPTRDDFDDPYPYLRPNKTDDHERSHLLINSWLVSHIYLCLALLLVVAFDVASGFAVSRSDLSALKNASVSPNLTENNTSSAAEAPDEWSFMPYVVYGIVGLCVVLLTAFVLITLIKRSRTSRYKQIAKQSLCDYDYIPGHTVVTGLTKSLLREVDARLKVWQPLRAEDAAASVFGYLFDRAVQHTVMRSDSILQPELVAVYMQSGCFESADVVEDYVSGIRTYAFAEHLSAKRWGQLLVKALFHASLSAARFPFATIPSDNSLHTLTDELRLSRRVAQDYPPFTIANITFASLAECMGKVIQTLDAHVSMWLPDRQLWFHGTSSESAMDILRGNLQHSKSRDNDFGHGLYLAKSVCVAAEYAVKTNFRRPCAVFVFAIPKSVLAALHGLDYYENSDATIDFNGQTFVKDHLFRDIRRLFKNIRDTQISRKDLRAVADNAEFIRGKISAGPPFSQFEFTSDASPPEELWKLQHLSDQLCIKRNSTLGVLEENLASILFLDCLDAQERPCWPF